MRTSERYKQRDKRGLTKCSDNGFNKREQTVEKKTCSENEENLSISTRKTTSQVKINTHHVLE